MLECEQFIYTAAKTPEKEGYQIIAQSEGITPQIVSQLAGYLYPIGTNIEKFEESRSLVLLDNHKIAYSIVKNIGVGYDGRRGTLYNHTFILNQDEFEKLGFDSRNLDDYFTLNVKSHGILDKIQLKPSSKKINFDVFSNLDENILSHLLNSITQAKKTAIIGFDHYDLIQNILMVLPESLRLVSFSSHVFEPKRQNEYDIIQSPPDIEFSKKWTIIPIKNIIGYKKKLNFPILDFQYIANLVIEKNESGIKQFHEKIMNMHELSTYEAMKLINYENLSQNTTDPEKISIYLLECAKTTKKIDSSLTLDYLKKAKQYCMKSNNKNLLDQIETGEILQEIIESPLNVKLIENALKRTDEYELKKTFINKIVKLKNKEIKNNFYDFLEDINDSDYADEFIKSFFQYKNLKSLLLIFIKNPPYWKKKLLSNIIEKILSNSSGVDPIFLNDALLNFKIKFDSIDEIEKTKNILHSSLNNHEFRNNVPPKTLLSFTENLILEIKNHIMKNTRASKNKSLEWTSSENFSKFKTYSNDMLTNLLHCLGYVKEYRTTEFTPSLKKKYSTILLERKSLMKKLQSIKMTKKTNKKESEPNIVFNPFKLWWPWS
ncbi:hypothetical protein [Candidatus Nitrosopumilus sediminis]|uniref:GTPase-associated protein 1 N-terminal domain-containing protein n=1 Tax=Candidatus Nitrosopumilus sediminis TaxID=1229909 RepID=K0BFC8_9ARCH|nr:hypothetical protein [Candidatus Nitrosopumilus sediminis]AFS82996.1 hypothetical protein NSED_05970 [Candidatus Nitrosopumilus sediminis]